MDQFLAVCGFVCLYPLLVGALPMYLWMKYGRRVRLTVVPEDEFERRQLREARPPVGGYARTQK